MSRGAVRIRTVLRECGQGASDAEHWSIGELLMLRGLNGRALWHSVCIEMDIDMF